MTGHNTDDFADRLHLVWGQGFLSPGGPAEVAEIVKDLDLADASVLDIGCGAGGPAIVLRRDFGARLVCIDVEAPLLDRAARLALDAGVADGVEFRLVDPGPLPFEDATFDVVFSKDALIQIPEKSALFAEILRVLKPGGTFAASDWLCANDAANDVEFQRFLERSHLDFAMATAS
ncbi:MAG TPA: class I SAM-dependent methyltransferase [Methylomirabilota bacterium]|nr:class I SAM-dependent methyltransferase [Methylomirabilota bacterium]